MNVGLDANTVFAGPAGVRTYLLELLPELIRLRQEDDEIVLLHADGHLPPEQLIWMLRGPRLRRALLPLSSGRIGRLWRKLGFPAAEMMGGRGRAIHQLDLCHSVAPPVLPGAPNRRILTLHILEAELGDTEVQPRRALLRSLRRAACIVTPSPRTKRALEELPGGVPAPIQVIANGVNRRFLEPPKAADVEALCASYPFLQEPYLLTIGSAAEPRRNLPFLLDAYALALASEPALPPLVVVTGPAVSKELEGAIGVRGLAGRVLVLEDLEGGALPALYRGAEMLLYPAFDNAYGQALLEAAGCGVAAIADPSCGVLENLAEGVFRPPQEALEWAAEILSLHREPERRRAAGERARSAARGLTWERSAEQHWQVYRSAASRQMEGAA